ncbi:RNA polymerase sigma factor [bacterium]|nr:RNA polymerase sigma factor [bacterium]
MQEAAAIKKCQSGDARAYRYIYDNYGQSLLVVARRMLGNDADAEDAVQNTFIRVYRSISSFEGRSRFSTWLHRIHIRVCLDILAKRRPETSENIQLLAIVDTPDPELKMTLDAAIADLPERQRACFVLHTISAMKQDEIASALGISPGGVKSNIFHARQKLRAVLS